MNAYLFLGSQYFSGPFHTALWQPVVPVTVTIISLALGYEKKTKLKVRIFLYQRIVRGNLVRWVFSGDRIDFETFG